LTVVRRSPLTWLLTLAVVLGVVAYIVAPRRAYANFLRLLATGDNTGLEKLVDYNALRSHFTLDFAAGLASHPPTPPISPQQQASLVTVMVNAAMTPEGLGQMVTQMGTAVPLEANGRPSPGAAPPDLRPSTSVQFQSPGRVDIHVRAAGVPDSAAGIYTFELEGMRWRLTRVWTERIAAAERSVR
jgi:hypothetical protein